MTRRRHPNPTDRAHPGASCFRFAMAGALLLPAQAGCDLLTGPSDGVEEITELPRALSTAEVEVIEM